MVQAGWRILTREGHELGEVVGFDEGRIAVQGHGVTGDRLLIPRHYIARESETEMRATLSVDAREAEAFVVPE